MNIICFIFGHKWKKELAQKKTEYAWSCWVETICTRCGKRKMS